jgi:archaemetzincin
MRRRNLIFSLIGLLLVAAGLRWWQSIPDDADELMKFQPPNAQQRLAAIGDLRSLSVDLQKAFDPSRDFVPMPKPGRRDWLAKNHEGGQTFEQFLQTEPNKPDHERHVIYLQPLSDFSVERAPSLEKLREFTEAYFTLETKLLPKLTLPADQITTRVREGTDRPQLFATDLLHLLEPQLPADAYCLLGITLADLYSSQTPTYVFGQASLRERTGVFSFARFDPAFYDERDPPNVESLILRRSCHTLAHEICHMFGMHHCIFFACTVNGSNNLDENDSRPMHVCPVCLRKLHSSIGFDPVERDRNLLQVYQRLGLHEDATWVERRLKTVASSRQ